MAVFYNRCSNCGSNVNVVRVLLALGWRYLCGRCYVPSRQPQQVTK